jgi:hypothetical protein
MGCGGRCHGRPHKVTADKTLATPWLTGDSVSAAEWGRAASHFDSQVKEGIGC